jgi:hypothetical protein
MFGLGDLPLTLDFISTGVVFLLITAALYFIIQNFSNVKHAFVHGWEKHRREDCKLYATLPMLLNYKKSTPISSRLTPEQNRALKVQILSLSLWFVILAPLSLWIVGDWLQINFLQNYKILDQGKGEFYSGITSCYSDFNGYLSPVIFSLFLAFPVVDFALLKLVNYNSKINENLRLVDDVFTKLGKTILENIHVYLRHSLAVFVLIIAFYAPIKMLFFLFTQNMEYSQLSFILSASIATVIRMLALKGLASEIVIK